MRSTLARDTKHLRPEPVMLPRALTLADVPTALPVTCSVCSLLGTIVEPSTIRAPHVATGRPQRHLYGLGDGWALCHFPS